MDHFKTLTDMTQGVRRAGSASLDLCHVARGWLDGFWELELKVWDMAAGALIVSEAGGEISTTNGDPFNLFNGQVLASNSKIHQEIVNVLTRE